MSKLDEFLDKASRLSEFKTFEQMVWVARAEKIIRMQAEALEGAKLDLSCGCPADVVRDSLKLARTEVEEVLK